MYPNTTQLQHETALDARIEALLFTSGSAMKRVALARVLGASDADTATAIHALGERLRGGGTALIETEDAVALVTAPSVEETIRSIRKNQAQDEIGQAALEVLSVILYRENTTRAAIDYVRGVNSAATIRTLMMRGLIERIPGKSENDAEAQYRITPALLSHLGVTHVSDIPGRDQILAEITAFEKRNAPEALTPEEREAAEDHADAEIPYDAL
jgi:segregation and condensation protein B